MFASTTPAQWILMVMITCVAIAFLCTLINVGPVRVPICPMQLACLGVLVLSFGMCFGLGFNQRFHNRFHPRRVVPVTSQPVVFPVQEPLIFVAPGICPTCFQRWPRSWTRCQPQDYRWHT